MLRVIRDQMDLVSFGNLFEEERVEQVEQFNLPRIERVEPELHQHRLQELHLVKLRLKNLRNDDILVQFRKELLDQRRLAAADFSGDDHEAFAVPHRIVHVGLAAAVSLATSNQPSPRTE